MFVGHETQLAVGYDTARERLATLIATGSLATVSEDVYGEGMTALLRVGPGRPGLGVSRLVRVRFRELISRGHSAVLTFRWEAVGPGGGLFPALDADLTLSPLPGERCLLRVDGVYRPPLGSVGAAIDRVFLNRIAAATIREFVLRVAAGVAPEVLAQSAVAADDPDPPQMLFQAHPLVDPLALPPCGFS